MLPDDWIWNKQHLVHMDYQYKDFGRYYCDMIHWHYNLHRCDMQIYIYCSNKCAQGNNHYLRDMLLENVLNNYLFFISL